MRIKLGYELNHLQNDPTSENGGFKYLFFAVSIG